MIFTNKFSLSQPVFDALTQTSYDEAKPGTISMTTALDPPRIRILRDRFKSELTRDASECADTTMGNAWHEKVQSKCGKNWLVEQRYYTEFLGRQLSGKIDAYDPVSKTLYDYKVPSVYEFKNGKVPEKFEQQLNGYKYLMELAGHEITRLVLSVYFRHWSEARIHQEDGYPPRKIMEMPVEIWDTNKTKEFLQHRVRAHINAETDLPVCDAKERWAKNEQWAVMKKGRKSALKLYDHNANAVNHAAQDKDFYVEHRPEEIGMRCEKYCPVSKHCDWYQGKISEKP